MLGAIIGAAILINLLSAALAGVSIPLLLHRMGIDPALAGSVILTTVTDVMASCCPSRHGDAVAAVRVGGAQAYQVFHDGGLADAQRGYETGTVASN